MRKALRSRRLKLGMTQRELGELIGRTESLVQALEIGRSRGSVDTWDRLEAVLGVPQKQLRCLAAPVKVREALSRGVCLPAAEEV